MPGGSGSIYFCGFVKRPRGGWRAKSRLGERCFAGWAPRGFYIGGASGSYSSCTPAFRCAWIVYFFDDLITLLGLSNGIWICWMTVFLFYGGRWGDLFWYIDLSFLPASLFSSEDRWLSYPGVMLLFFTQLGLKMRPLVQSYILTYSFTRRSSFLRRHGEKLVRLIFL